MAYCSLTASICPKSIPGNGNVLKTLSLLTIKNPKNMSSYCENTKSNKKIIYKQQNMLKSCTNVLEHRKLYRPNPPIPVPRPSFADWNKKDKNKEEHHYHNPYENVDDNVLQLDPYLVREKMLSLNFNKFNDVTTKIKDDLFSINKLVKDRIKYGKDLNNSTEHINNNVIKYHKQDMITNKKEFYPGECEYNEHKDFFIKNGHKNYNTLNNQKNINKRKVLFNPKKNIYYQQLPHKERPINIEPNKGYHLMNDLMDSKILQKPIKRTDYLIREMQNVKKQLNDSNLEAVQKRFNNLRDDSTSIYPGKIQKLHMHYASQPFQATEPPFKIDAPILLKPKLASEQKSNITDIGIKNDDDINSTNLCFQPRRMRSSRRR